MILGSMSITLKLSRIQPGIAEELQMLGSINAITAKDKKKGWDCEHYVNESHDYAVNPSAVIS